MGQTQTQYTRQTPAARNKNPLLICIIVLLVVAVGIGGYFMISEISGDSSGSADTGSAGGSSPVGGSSSGGSPGSGSAGSGSPVSGSSGSASVGSVIEFGGYDWRVLEVRSGHALVISEHILEWRAYHDVHPIYEGVTWEGSDIRSYLNGDFYNSFSSSDRVRIQEMLISNDDNPWYGTDGGNDTTDNIFLLSLEEVVRYFGDSGELRNRPMDSDRDWSGDGYADYIDDRYNSARVATELSGRPSISGGGMGAAGNGNTDRRDDRYNSERITSGWHWWSRSPGVDPYVAAYVEIDGEIYVRGRNNSDDICGVRPALWLEL